MCLVRADDVYVTVKTAVEGEVCDLGVNSVVGCIVNGDNEKVVILECLGYVNSPGGVTAVVVREKLAVKVSVCGGVSSVYLKKIAVCLGKLRLVKSLCIVAGAAVVIVTAVLTVGRVPGVRKIHRLPARRHFCGDLGSRLRKRPICVKINYFSHRFSPFTVRILLYYKFLNCI